MGVLLRYTRRGRCNTALRALRRKEQPGCPSVGFLAQVPGPGVAESEPAHTWGMKEVLTREAPKESEGLDEDPFEAS